MGVVLAVSAVARAQDRFDDPPIAPAGSRAVAPSVDGHELLWPATTPPTALPHPVLRRGHDMGLISAGIVGLSLGMIVGVIIASFDLAFGNCERFTGSFASTRVQCGTAALSLIPFAGSVIVGSVSLGSGSVTAETIIPGGLAIAPQIVGLVLLLMGMHGYTEDLVPEADFGDVVVRVTPILSSSVLGGSLSLSL